MLEEQLNDYKGKVSEHMKVIYLLSFEMRARYWWERGNDVSRKLLGVSHLDEVLHKHIHFNKTQ